MSPTTPNTVDVSIVIPCRNEAGHIQTFLDCLAVQDFGNLSWEAIIADGMSDDGTRDVLARYASHPRIRCIDNPERIVSTALNRAIRQALGEVILRMDMHTEYAADYVRRSVEMLEATGADNVGGPARTSARGYMARAIAAAYHSRFCCGGARFHDENYEGFVDTVTYGCWKKLTLERIGLFDEMLVRNQDDELNLRLIQTGGRIWQSPSLVSWYRPRPDLPSLMRQYFQYGFWKIPVIMKHKIPASWRHLVPGGFVLANVALLGAAAVSWMVGWEVAALWQAALWIGLAGVYAAAALGAALFSAKRYGWLLLPVLPAVFASYQLSYGIGFLAGALYWPLRRTPKPAGRLFAGITR
jgi:succinoglycan biosynthesis protein ExoA